MAFDQKTRNLLQRTVSACRRILDREFTAQLQELYGIQPDGTLVPLATIDHLADEELEVARLLRERINHLEGGSAAGALTRQAAKPEHVARVIREQAFTVLNRLAALRLCEERGLVLECVRKGASSEGFQLFTTSAGNALGTTQEAYGEYLHCLFDELAVDLGVLFDRFSPFALLFPRQDALTEVLKELNGSGQAAEREEMSAEQFGEIWQADETIGWIYQYYNDEAERKKMREESSAPRNSRELAVRNQFFTPRYVVEFLTDNTLGRIWYEMTQGDSTLREQCRYLIRRPTENFLKPDEIAPEQPKQDNASQADLLKQPVHIPHRPLKDPRTILMLDPACGSMHFGLYAFDLFEVIYDEAWALEERLGADALSRPPGMKSLHDTYAGRDTFLKDVPRLIIELNLHGIDIDPRCVQIAGLSLWLRAQKAWQRLGLEPAERPAIKRSNIVCAEPMPGEKELLREFVEREFPAAERAVCLRLLEAIFDKMQLAGEAGSLLKIEEEIRSAIEDARRDWTKMGEYLPGFGTDNPIPDPRLLTTDFWERIEERIYRALRDYAEQAENGGGFQRRLFAEDAARGFAFIDVCRKRYDVAVMNPPFGQMGEAAYRYAVMRFPDSYSDFGIAFMDRGVALGAKGVLVGAITSRSFLSVKDAERFRTNVAIPSLQVVVDLGLNVMDGAWVDSSAQVFSGRSRQAFIQFIKVRAQQLTPEVLQSTASHVFRSRDAFQKVPKSRLSYELMGGLEDLLTSGDGGLEESGIALSRTGGKTFDDERFRRVWWEVSPQHIGPKLTWCFVAQSCEFNLFYYPYTNIVKWSGNGDELAERNRQVNEQTAQARQGASFYYQPGLSFSRRGEPSIAFRTYPESCMFSSNGPVVLPQEMHDAFYLLGFLNSSWIRAAIHTQAHKFSYTVGHPKAVRWIDPAPEPRAAIAAASQRIVSLKQVRFQFDERDNHFLAPIRSNESRLLELFSEYSKDCERMRCEMVKELKCIDRAVADVYSLVPDEVEWSRYNISVDDVGDPSDIPFASASDFTANVVSYILGAALGRWDVRFTTGEQAAPALPDPFASLPACPSGQLQNAQGLPVRPEDLPAAYPISIPWDGIFVDDPNHPLDIERRVRQVIEIIWGGRATSQSAGGPTAESIEHEACEILGVKSLRDYFRKPAGFFAGHLKRYSKSRRQAPIYWPLSTASGSYTLWIYYHRLTPDTLYKCVQQFVNPKLADVEKQLTHLRTVLAANEGGAKERKHLEELEDLRRELIELRTELELWAPKWKPNLNDGVLISAAPLWKLFRLAKWQKDLKACWLELEKGDYDWAHLAYGLWPVRVREKCRSDRSLAIAHGLEDLCQIKAPAKKVKKAVSRKGDMGPELEIGS